MEFKLPDIGEGVQEGELIRWLVKDGDTVAADQAVLEVMTDKATVEIPAPVAGTISGITAKEGQMIKVGQVLAQIGGGAAPAAEAPKAEAPKADAPKVEAARPSTPPPPPTNGSPNHGAGATAAGQPSSAPPPAAPDERLAQPRRRRDGGRPTLERPRPEGVVRSGPLRGRPRSPFSLERARGSDRTRDGGEGRR